MTGFSTIVPSRRARARGLGSSHRFSATLDINFIYLAELVRFADRPVGYMRLAFPLDRVHAEESSAVWLGRAAIVQSPPRCNGSRRVARLL